MVDTERSPPDCTCLLSSVSLPPSASERKRTLIDTPHFLYDESFSEREIAPRQPISTMYLRWRTDEKIISKA